MIPYSSGIIITINLKKLTKSNGYIRADPGFKIEGCGKKEDISPKEKTKLGKRNSNTGKDKKGKVNTGEDWVRRPEIIQSNT